MFPVIRQEKFQIGTLPWACLAFFIAYLLIHFTWQANAGHKRQELLQWYQQTGLYDMEWESYASWLTRNGQGNKAARLEQAHADGEHMSVFLEMAFDPAFERENRTEGERYWSSSQFYEWQENREQFHRKKTSLPRVAAGLNPSDWVPADFLTYHFLHRDPLHWLVALLILVPFAWPLEARLGWKRIPLLWMLGGALAGLAYVAFVDSYRPMIGSTPVVSALIGAFLGLYGREKLPFITLDPKTRRKRVVELPAWVLAPLWLLLPLYELLAGDPAPHLWVAQLGGLAGGFALVQLLRDTEVASEEREETGEEDEEERQLRQALTSGWTSIAALQFTEAERQFEKALQLRPGHFDALTGLYQMRKLRPESPEFEQAAQDVLAAQTAEKGRVLQQQQIYRDFRKRRDVSELPLSTRLQLTMRLAGVGELKEAEELMESALSDGTAHELLPKSLYTLSEAFGKAGNQGKAERFRTLAENARDQAA